MVRDLRTAYNVLYMLTIVFHYGTLYILFFTFFITDTRKQHTHIHICIHLFIYFINLYNFEKRAKEHILYNSTSSFTKCTYANAYMQMSLDGNLLFSETAPLSDARLFLWQSDFSFRCMSAYQNSSADYRTRTKALDTRRELTIFQEVYS